MSDRPHPSTLAAEPSRQIAIVTCMDTRVDPYRVCGVGLGEAHILRNAGGRVSADTIRSLTLGVHFLGVRAVWVVHHTDCGLANAGQAEIVDRVAQATGANTAATDYMAIAREPDALLSDVRVLRSHPALVDVEVEGFVYDVASDELIPADDFEDHASQPQR